MGPAITRVADGTTVAAAAIRIGDPVATTAEHHDEAVMVMGARIVETAPFWIIIQAVVACLHQSTGIMIVDEIAIVTEVVIGAATEVAIVTEVVIGVAIGVAIETEIETGIAIGVVTGIGTKTETGIAIEIAIAIKTKIAGVTVGVIEIVTRTSTTIAGTILSTTTAITITTRRFTTPEITVVTRTAWALTTRAMRMVCLPARTMPDGDSRTILRGRTSIKAPRAATTQLSENAMSINRPTAMDSCVDMKRATGTGKDTFPAGRFGETPRQQSQ